MTTRLLALALVAAVSLLPVPACAFHTVFDFTVDRFEIDGNQVGPYDGHPDWVEEFNTSLGSWSVYYGTASVSGGRLHVQSPGQHVAGPDGMTLDLTELKSGYTVQKYFGNFTAIATFDPIIPPEGHFYHVTLYTYGGPAFYDEFFGIDVHTLDGETRIEQHLVELDLQHGTYATVQTEWQTITAADLLGQLKFRFDYDGTTSTIVTSFSLDGGATFTSPFTPAPIFTSGRIDAQFLLGADPHVSAPPTTTLAPTTTTSSTITTTTSTSTSEPLPSTTTTLPSPTGCERTDCLFALRNDLRLRVRSQGRSLTWAWRRGALFLPGELGNPTAAGGTRYTLCITDANGEMRFREEIPAGGTCDGRACWRANTRTMTYRHAHAIDALTALKLRAATSVSQVKATAKGPTLLGTLPLAGPVVVQLEADGGPCWTATFDAPLGAAAQP